MARPIRQRVSYVLPLSDSTAGHRLGVNSLALDRDKKILYSAGRGGSTFAWSLETPSEQRDDSSKSRYFRHVQTHSHWINDIILTRNNDAVVSASSDTTVKLWRPFATEALAPQTIGNHKDYVKCLAVPGSQTPWVAAGGLDRTIVLWDLAGAGRHVEIQVPDETSEKASVYALAATESMIASGGPESIVKIWDPRSGKRISQFIGHTDNIRSLLISQDGDNVISASSDRTVRMWSLRAGRCVYNLTMHNDSVWSLCSEYPYLSVFYSGDKSGLVVKNDARGASEPDQGISVALFQEQEGINKILSADGSVWTATAASSINRWQDADISMGIQAPEATAFSLQSISRSRKRSHVSRGSLGALADIGSKDDAGHLPPSCVLRISNILGFPRTLVRGHDRISVQFPSGTRKSSLPASDAILGPFSPLRKTPTESIEGQHGIINHVLLNDRRRVLTVDTAGDVLLWDILQCSVLKSFGKRHMEDVLKEVNTLETVPSWCTVDTRTGVLTCTLDENHAFDAEVYGDELPGMEQIDGKDDYRINLGKWVLRHLFSKFIDEELARDHSYRLSLITDSKSSLRHQDSAHSAVIASHSIAPQGESQSTTILQPGQFQLEPKSSHIVEGTDYFSSKQKHLEKLSQSDPDQALQAPSTPSEDSNDCGVLPKSATSPVPAAPATPATPTTTKETPSTTSFGKRLRTTFTSRKSSRAPTAVEPVKAIADSGQNEEVDSKEISSEETYPSKYPITAMLERLHQQYKDQVATLQNGDVPTLMAPTPLSEAPELSPPNDTIIIIQEEQASSAEITDVFEGTRGSLGTQASIIENTAPLWLGELLLQNRMPQKDIVKISFTLQPYKDQLPVVTADNGLERLNANRMLRAKKVLGYVKERLPSDFKVGSDENSPSLQLYCQDQVVPTNMTLATIRAYFWRSGNDIALFYGSSENHD